ncbi:MAG TPA: 50S ribosomal protein L23 [Candidatus Saccharimonadales bacterium]|nr:50S ribosomal protein L23 [Candidatus Saccharimonadales bacterium]
MALFGSKKTPTEDKKSAAAKTTTEAKVVESKKEAQSMKDLYAETATVKTAGKAKGTVYKHAASSRALVKPLITEKATHLASENKYVFVIARGANKIETAKAIQAVYGVNPVAVNIVNMKGKRVARGKIRGQRKDWKKAIVTLAKGDSIKVYEGV